MKKYFYSARGYKDGRGKWISGIYDSEEKDIQAVWNEIKVWLIREKEFDGDFIITGFNKV